MSKTVDTRTVEMRFDNKNFESNVKQSMSTLDKLKQKLKLDGASKGLEEVEKKSKKLDFKDLDRSIDDVGKKFSALETIATGVFLKIGMSAADAGLKIAKSFTIDQIAAGWNKYAEMTSATQTIMANLRDETGKWADEASKMDYVNEQLDKLMTFSDETSYRFINMTQNVGKFVSSGLDLEEVVTAMEGIAGLAGLAGKTPEQAEIVFDTFSKAITRGYVSARDFYNIQTVMTAEAKEQAIAIGEELGVIEKGSVTISNFRDSFIGKGGKSWFNKDVMMRLLTTYGSGADVVLKKMEELGVSSTTIMKQMEEDGDEFVKSIGYRAFKADQEAKTFREAMDATADAVSSKWAQVFKNIFGDYLEARTVWTDLSEDLWNIFAAPLDDLNEIMSLWKRGFILDPSKNFIDIALEQGKLDDINSAFTYVSRSAAEAAVETSKLGDDVYYTIQTLDNGTDLFVKHVKNAAGGYDNFVKDIYDTDKEFVSGRTMLLEGFKNLINTFLLNWEDEEGKEHLSVLGALKKAFLEVFYPDIARDSEGGKKSIAQRLVELTKKFKDFTEKLKPLGEKLRNIFKGFFTAINIVRKFIIAIIKPFKELFKTLFGDLPDGILGFSDSVSTWIQKFDEFLEKNKVFKKVSAGISKAIEKISQGLDWLSQKLTGLPLKELVTTVKDKIVAFFNDYDFEGKFQKIGEFFSNIIDQIRQVETDDLPDKLTPLQNFWIGFKNIWEGIKKFFSILSVPFKKIGEFISNFFTGITESLASKETEKKVSRFQPIWEGIKKVFQGIGNFFEKIGPALEKIGSWLGDKLSTIGDAIAEFAQNHDAKELIEYILKGGLLASLSSFFFSLSSVFGGTGGILKSIKKDFDAIGGVLKAYQREINASTILEIAMAIGILAGSLWVLAQIPEDKLKSAGTALAIIAGAVAGFSALKDALKIFTNLSNKTDTGKLLTSDGPLAGIKNILTGVVSASIFANDATAKFVKICLGILLAALAIKAVVKAMIKVADAFKALAAIPPEVIEKGGKVMAQVMVAFGAFAMLAGTANKSTTALFAALGALILVFAIKKLVNLLAELGGDSEKMKKIRAALDNFKDVFEIVGKIAKIVVGIGIGIAVVQTIITGFASLGKQGSYGTAQVLKQFGKNFLRIALSFAVMGLAMALLTSIAAKNNKYDWNAVVGFIYAFTAIVGSLQAVAVGLASFGKRSGQYTADLMKQFGKNFLRIAGSMLIIAAAFAIFKWINLDTTTLAILTIFFSIFMGIVTVLTLGAAQIATEKKHLYFLNTLKGIGKLFLTIAASMLIIAAAFAVFKLLDIDADTMKSAGIIFLIFTIIAGLFAGIAYMGAVGEKGGAASAKAAAFSKNLLSIANLFGAIAGALVLVAAAFAIMSALNFKEHSMWEIAGLFGAFLVVAGAVIIFAGMLVKRDVMKTLFGISVFVMALAGALVVVASAFAIMATIDFNNNKNSMWSIAGVFGAFIVIAGLLVIFAGMMLRNVSSILGLLGVSILIVSVATSLILVACAVSIIAKSANETQVNSAVKIIKAFGIFAGVMAALGLVAALTGVGLIGFIAIAGLMVLAAGSLLIVGLAVKEMSGALNEKDVDQVIRIVKAVGILIGVLAVIGVIAGLTMVGAAGILTIAVLILAIGAACLMVGKGVEAATEGFADFADAFDRFVNTVVTKGQDFVNGISGIFIGLLDTIIESGPKISDAIYTLIVSVADGFYRGASESSEKIVGSITVVIKAIAKGLADSAYEVSNAIVTIFLMTLMGVLDALVECIDPTIKSFIAFVNTLADSIRDNTEPMIEAGENLANALLYGLTEVLSRDGGLFGGLIGAGLKAGLGLEDFDLTAVKDKKAGSAITGGLPPEDISSTESAAEAGTNDGKTYTESFESTVSDNFGSVISKYLPLGSTSGSSFGEGFISGLGSILGVDIPVDKVNMEGLMGLLSGAGTEGGIVFDDALMEQLSGYLGVDLSGKEINTEALTGLLSQTGSDSGSNLIDSFLGSYGSDDSSNELLTASEKLTKEGIEEPLQSTVENAFGWGRDMVKNYADGILANLDLPEGAATKLGKIIHAILGFSEPEKGPLSDFHTYAPDMIRLWCSGVYDNLDMVSDSSDAMSNRISDGFSTALDYVSGLIDGGMSDELTIRPIMDLSEIQNGVDKLDSMLSGNTYPLYGTAGLTSSAAYDVRGGTSKASGEATQPTMASNDTFNNTFNITNSDPDAVAQKVSKIIQQQVVRKQAVWAR